MRIIIIMEIILRHGTWTVIDSDWRLFTFRILCSANLNSNLKSQ